MALSDKDLSLLVREVLNDPQLKAQNRVKPRTGDKIGPPTRGGLLEVADAIESSPVGAFAGPVPGIARSWAWDQKLTPAQYAHAGLAGASAVVPLPPQARQLLGKGFDYAKRRTDFAYDKALRGGHDAARRDFIKEKGVEGLRGARAAAAAAGLNSANRALDDMLYKNKLTPWGQLSEETRLAASVAAPVAAREANSKLRRPLYKTLIPDEPVSRRNALKGIAASTASSAIVKGVGGLETVERVARGGGLRKSAASARDLAVAEELARKLDADMSRRAFLRGSATAVGGAVIPRL